MITSQIDISETNDLIKHLKSLSLHREGHSIEFFPFLEFFSDENHFDVHAVDDRERTALHHAAVRGHKTVLKLLLQAGVSPNALDRDEHSALVLAIREENVKCAEVLVENGEVDIDIGGGQLGSPLHTAIVILHAELVRQLLERGADPNYCD